MQYILQLTTLGTQHHLFRLVSVDGQADLEHVLSLCNLSFAYTNYADKSLAFAQSAEARAALCPDLSAEDEDRIGPSGHEFDPWWHEPIDASVCTPYVVSDADKVLNFDTFLDQQLSATDKAALRELAEASSLAEVALRPRFLYTIHGVQHLVEIKLCASKLMCFLPATLAGEGLIPNEDLSCAALDAYQDWLEQQDVDESESSLNLRDCTHRMRALGALRGSISASEALVQAGAKALKFKLD